jgi:hypothetical protein
MGDNMQIILILLVAVVPFVLIYQSSMTLQNQKIILNKIEKLQKQVDLISSDIYNVDYEVKEDEFNK